MNVRLQVGETTTTLTIEDRETLLLALRRQGVEMQATCGGKGICGKCRVKLLREGKIPVGEVLACRITGAQLLGMWARERFDTVVIEETKPMQTQRKREVVLPENVKRDEKTPDAVHYGVAFDLGTTTIAAMLWDLSSGSDERTPLATAAAENPQSVFGADVISRIEYAMENKGGAQRLHRAMVECMNRLLGELTEAMGISISNVYRLSAVGNSTMMHTLLERDLSGLAKAPFAGEELPVEAEAKTLGLAVGDGVKLRTLPLMGGHLGSDAAAVLLALRLPEKKEAALALDIGTNGELLLTDGKGGLWGCSAAAGPAFEGGNISCGMRGEPGAIERVRPAPGGRGVVVSVINGAAETTETTETTGVDGATETCAAARGICGSGLIDAAAALLAMGEMDDVGRLRSGESFFLTPKVFLTQKDIRQLQMAKGAIGAGRRILAKRASDEIRSVYLAGAFGSYLDWESAVAIGLLPKGIPVCSCGNAAGVGASMILLSEEEWRRGCEWAGRLVHLELAEEPEFAEIFLEEMYFRRV